MSQIQQRSADVVVIGGGIVGLATAHAIQLRSPGVTLIVLEKEDAVATHQSGRNSDRLPGGGHHAIAPDR